MYTLHAIVHESIIRNCSVALFNAACVCVCVCVCVCTYKCAHFLCLYVCVHVCVLSSGNIIKTFSQGAYCIVTTRHKEAFSSQCLIVYYITYHHKLAYILMILTFADMLSHQTTAVSSDNMATILQMIGNISVPAKVSSIESPG